ncbi:unnamed protein product, partial [Tetraodon nigroviridis]
DFAEDRRICRHEWHKNHSRTEEGMKECADLTGPRYLLKACSSCEIVEDSLDKNTNASCGGEGPPTG